MSRGKAELEFLQFINPTYEEMGSIHDLKHNYTINQGKTILKKYLPFSALAKSPGVCPNAFLEFSFIPNPSQQVPHVYI